MLIKWFVSELRNKISNKFSGTIRTDPKTEKFKKTVKSPILLKKKATREKSEKSVKRAEKKKEVMPRRTFDLEYLILYNMLHNVKTRFQEHEYKDNNLDEDIRPWGLLGVWGPPPPAFLQSGSRHY